MSFADARTRYGKIHALAPGAERTDCGKLPDWNWFTERPGHPAVDCKACVRALRSSGKA